ncbi:MAG: hypothetical protein IJ658_09930, partial [Kiritimatiellae bacterium]|nr:hypothetical protein [Kiritimatiellia bacterium]
MKTRIALVFCVCAAMSAARTNGFDWPPAGGTATIPAGETVEVAGNGVTAAAACGAIVIEQGATLKFTGITANATFAGSISGSGTFSAENASTSTYRLTFTGDLSSFTGSFDFKYVYATFNTSASGSAPIRMLQANTAGFYSQFAGGYTYNNPLDATVGANYGLRVLAGSELGGGIAWRGSGRLHGGRITGPFTLYGTCYAVDGVAFEGGVLPGGTGGKYLEADNGTMHLKSPVGAISRLCVINGDGKAIFYGENLLDDSITLAIGKTWGASHRCGTYDLNGYSQRAKSLSLADQENMIASSTIVKSADPATLTLLNQDANVNYRGQLKGAVSLDLSSASGKTLALSGTANDTTGSLAVRSGTLALAAGARFPNVSSLVATNAGTLSVSTENVNPAVELALFGSGKINVDAGVTFFVCRATLDGAYLPGGEYTKDSPALQGRFSGDGTLVVVNGAPAAAGDTYVWTGAAGDGLLTTDGNWEDGAAPD